MNKLIFFILFITFFILPSLASADVEVSEPITSDTTWSPANGVYIINSSFSVASGTTLTIEAGTIVKSKTTNIYIDGPSIYGRLIANGTAENPIYFTSTNNDISGDTNNDGPSTGNPGEWQGLHFKPGSYGSLDHVDLSFAGSGGYAWGKFVGIKNDKGILDIKNSNIHDNYANLFDWVIGHYKYGTGIENKNGVLSVINSTISSSTNGLNIWSGSVVVISDSIIKNNAGYGAGYGIFAVEPSKLTLLNNIFSGNTRTAYIDGLVDFNHSGNTSEDLSRKGFMIGGYMRDGATLHSSDLPVIIDNGIIIRTGDLLNIAPSTIVKIGGQGTGSIKVYGALTARGTPDKKIYFTSLKDDSIGGDTNGDGETTTPNPKNWEGFYLESGSADFDNVVMKYGGYNYNGEYLNIASMIYNRNANLKISNSKMSQSQSTILFQDGGQTEITKSEIDAMSYGIWFRGGSLNISQSSLLSPTYGIAIYNQGSESNPTLFIDARNNWWGSADGPKDTSSTTPTGTGSNIAGNILYIPFLTSWPPIEEHRINPVIIIPGIMGSAKKNGQWLVDPILHTYDDLIATLEANGYQKEKNLFTFPYEWRDSNVQTANLLKDKISAVKSACEIAQGAGAISQVLGETDCTKIDLIAHSMGGLVAREYIQSSQYNNDVDQLIFLGTPHKGSPKAYLQWEAGESDRDFLNRLTIEFFNLEAVKNGFSNVFDYVRNRPITSVKELLPTYNYLKDKETGILRAYPNNYPTNSFLEDLNSNISNLLNSGIRITNVVGNSGNNTIEKIRVVATTKTGIWEHGQPENFYQPILSDNGLERGSGDNTVTINSANLDSTITNKEVPSTHNRIPTEQSSFIFKTLTNKDSIINIDNGSNIDVKVLLLQLKSPIDVAITAPDGKKIGKNFVTGEEYNEIPSGFYSGFNNGDDEYITIPNPIEGEYKIELQGTDNGGEYGVVASYISETESISTDYFGVTGVNQISNLKTNISNTNPESLNITSTDPITPSTLLNHVELSFQWNWITNNEAYEKLRDWAQSIVRMDTKTKTKFVDRKLAKMLYDELPKLLDKKDINISAYNLLKKDLEYLINNN